MSKKRNPSVGKKLLGKSREAALNAVQTFNNPLTTFKAETFIVLMVIAWTYLLHAYYHREGIEYRYFEPGPKRRKFNRTKAGAFKYWDLEHCLKEKRCPLDGPTMNNLRFLIGLRHEIEHHGSTGTDKHFTGRYLACCLNYERFICNLFDQKHSLAGHAAFALTFRDFVKPTMSDKMTIPLPSKVTKYLQKFDAALEQKDLDSHHFSCRLFFIPKLTNHHNQSDNAIEFISADSELAKEVDKQYWVQREVER